MLHENPDVSAELIYKLDDLSSSMIKSVIN